MTEQQLLKYMAAHFSYCGKTGNFITVVPQSNSNKVGDVVGRVQENGYRRISIKRKFYQAHRLVWLWHHRTMPKMNIDHINGDKADNRIENLRDCDQQMNARNVTKARSTNKIGVLGVTAARDKFRANIWVKGKSLYLGVYDTVEQASGAYRAAKRKYHKGAVP